MRIRIDGKPVVMLGPSCGIGRAIAAALEDSGGIVREFEDAGIPAAGVEAPYLVVNLSAALAGNTAEDDFIRFDRAARAFAGSAERVINVISVAGLVPLRGAAGQSALQAGLASLTRSLAMELAPRTLVNAVAVGAIEGDREERFVGHTAVRRAGTAAEVARATLFLADPANSYTTGHVMAVDGGWSIGYARDF